MEAGKKAAREVLELQSKVLATLGSEPHGVLELASELSADPGELWALLRHLAANRSEVTMQGQDDPGSARFVRSPV